MIAKRRTATVSRSRTYVNGTPNASTNARSTAAMNSAFSSVGFWMNVTAPLVGVSRT
jgi:hypothetical protein